MFDNFFMLLFLAQYHMTSKKVLVELFVGDIETYYIFFSDLCLYLSLYFILFINFI